MIQRYRIAFLSSLLVFISILAIYLNIPKVEEKVKKTQIKVMKIALISPVKEVKKKKLKKPVIIKKPKPKKIIKKKIVKKKVVKKKVIKKKKPKKVVQKKITKKITKKKIIKKRVIKKKVISKPIEEYIPIAPPILYTPPPVYAAPKQVAIKPVLKPVLKPKKVVPPQTIVKNDYHKKAFLRKVRSQIIANKTYPKIAKRRHIEGSVKVRFDITANGQVTNIRFINGKRVFQKSIRKTLERTFPMGIPAEVRADLPISDVSVVLHFNIR